MKNYYFTVQEEGKKWEELPQASIKCRGWNCAEVKAFELSEKYGQIVRMSESKGYCGKGFFYAGRKMLADEQQHETTFNQLLPNYLFVTCLADKTSKELFMKNLREYCSMRYEKNFQFYQACLRKDFSHIEYNGNSFKVI